MAEPQAPAAGTPAPADPPATPTTPAVAPAVAPPAAATPPEPPTPRSDDSPPWLPDRLAKAKTTGRTELLNELGFPDIEAAKTAQAEAKALKEASLTDAEKMKLRLQELEPRAARAAALETRLKSIADSQFAALSEQQQGVVDAVAQGDTEKRLELISVLAAAGASPPPAAPPPEPATPPAPQTPPPANTAPPGAPPVPAPTRTKFEEYQAIQNPMAKALFLRINKREIDASRPAQP